jgi:hypothetical protein
MAFVEHAVIEVDRREDIVVIAANIIGSYNDICGGQQGLKSRPLCGRANICNATEEWSILLDFLLPMSRQRRRADNQRR